MTTFDFSSSDLKNYPHFDSPISLREIRKLVTCKTRVASNTFFPFMRYEEGWQPYREKGAAKPDRKSRPIRYGARRDAYIFTHYRRQLSKLYEERLVTLGISDCPIAYRKIRKPGQSGGKCNIDFAKDAFNEIDRIGNCVAIALDISKFFEHLDHARIKEIWCDLLGVARLPEDHFAVFKNVTDYRFVDQREVYRRLGFFGPKVVNGKSIEGFLQPFEDIPKKLCTMQEFRQKICGYGGVYTSLIQKNQGCYGIPQGSPISDLIANFYLIDFDLSLANYARSLGGCYMRYSDDILLILPGGEAAASAAADFAVQEITKQGNKLRIKNEKTCIVQYERDGQKLRFKHLSGPQGSGGLEYLGFRYDGRKVYIRESTVSRLYRKISSAINQAAHRHAEKNPSLPAADLIKTDSLLLSRFMRQKKEKLTDDHRTWTFYSYILRASSVFGVKGDRIFKQVDSFEAIMRRRVAAALVRAVSRRKPTAP
ncbi:reverse transcriptase domain-containing protein [Paracoccus sediminis]|nr:reverse transcriptase domain-containing protein [Paracoccus sediminis]SNR56728.1 Reverse transcriptase (RNA-dependent DNA polymerase) [Paracoccus sediminis]